MGLVARMSGMPQSSHQAVVWEGWCISGKWSRTVDCRACSGPFSRASGGEDSQSGLGPGSVGVQAITELHALLL